MGPVKRQLNLSLCIAAGLLLPGSSYAACDRDDIEYYLSKGFTTSQITALCTHGSDTEKKAPVTEAAPSPATQPKQSTAPAKPESQPSVVSPAPVAAPVPASVPSEPAGQAASAAGQAYESNEQFLKTAIDGHDVILGQNTLTYVLKMCMESGEEDLFGFAPESCPNVKYTVSLNGLELKKVKKKYTVYGPTVVRVKGQIKREIVGNFNPENDEARIKVMDQIGSGPKTDIPIRTGIPADQVKKVFNDIIK